MNNRTMRTFPFNNGDQSIAVTPFHAKVMTV